MLLNLSEFKSNQQSNWQGIIDIKDLLNVQTNGRFTSLRYRLTVSAEENNTVSVCGDLSGEVSARCARCLTLTKKTYLVPVQLLFRKTQDEQLEQEDIILINEEQIDLSALLIEEFIVQLPYRYLCGEECKGLCATCGMNRNKHSCNCSQKRIDPRLAVLEQWRKSGQK